MRQKVPATERFWPKVSIRGPNECWPWTGYVGPDGYGRFSEFRDNPMNAHRFAYTDTTGNQSAAHVEHRCHTEALVRGECAGGPMCLHRRCCNPAHLEGLTVRENTLRGSGPTAINAAKTCCSRGHPFNTENTGHDKKGRFCRTCKRDKQRERRALTTRKEQP